MMAANPKDIPPVVYVFSSAREALTWPDRNPPVPYAITLPASLYEFALEQGLDLGPAPGETLH
jgi:hypothetical protein